MTVHRNNTWIVLLRYKDDYLENCMSCTFSSIIEYAWSTKIYFMYIFILYLLSTSFIFIAILILASTSSSNNL